MAEAMPGTPFSHVLTIDCIFWHGGPPDQVREEERRGPASVNEAGKP